MGVSLLPATEPDMLETTDVHEARPSQSAGGAAAQLYARLAASPAVQLGLVLLAHIALVGLVPLTASLSDERHALSVPAAVDARLLLRLLITVIALEGLLAYLPFRAVARRERKPLRFFVRCWCQSCQWGLLAIPSAAVAFVTVARAMQVDVLVPAFYVFASLYLLAGPALLARGILRAQRIARWRPVCPECGYSLRHAVGTTCSECGSPFLAQTRSYRRWAVGRLAWDRLRRDGLLIAYIHTMLAILFRPRRAGRSVTAPDRWPRAIRWATFHFVAFALVATLFGSRFYFLEQVARILGWMPLRQVPFERPDPPHTLVFGWAAQSFLAHLFGLALLLVTAWLVAMAMPACSKVARRSIFKWSLYAIVAICPATLLWYLCQLHLPGSVGMPQAGVVGQILSVWRPRGTTTPLASLLAVAYGLWWAAGVSANPYLRRRDWRTLVLYLAAFIGLWLLLTNFLFDLGPLEWLQ